MLEQHKDQEVEPAEVEARFKARTRKSWHPFEIAAVAGLVSTVLGSVLVVVWMYLLSNQVDNASLLTILFIYMIYSGIVVVPVSIVIACPLMMVCRTAPNWAWLLMCVLSALVFAGVAAIVFRPDIFLQALSFVMTYAVVFGISAILLRQKGRKGFSPSPTE